MPKAAEPQSFNKPAPSKIVDGGEFSLSKKSCEDFF